MEVEVKPTFLYNLAEGVLKLMTELRKKPIGIRNGKSFFGGKLPPGHVIQEGLARLLLDLQ